MKSNDLETAAIRAALQAIAAQHHGVLNPADVLASARAPEHPLHRHFEWNDGAAGEAYRMLQVGALVRRVRLTIVRGDDVERSVRISTTRAYQSRPSMRRGDGGYEPIGDILNDEDKRHELIAQVLHELGAYRKRYAELVELQNVWIAVDDAIGDLTSSPSAPDGESRTGAAG